MEHTPFESAKPDFTCKEQQTATLALVHRSLSNGIRSSKASAAGQWLRERKLTVEASGACFNSGQIHHRKPQQFKDRLEAAGFLKRSPVPTNGGQIPYTAFGSHSILFPLKNEKHQIVNFYAIAIQNGKTGWMNHRGLYPCYPPEATKKLYIVPTILDAATIIESKTLDNREAVMALMDGQLKPQHLEAIKRLTQLQEIIVIEHQPEKPSQ